jgi:hypothetical protein
MRINSLLKRNSIFAMITILFFITIAVIVGAFVTKNSKTEFGTISKLIQGEQKKIKMKKQCSILFLIDNNVEHLGDMYNTLEYNTPCYVNIRTSIENLKELQKYDYIICSKPLNYLLLKDISKRLRGDKVFFFTKDCFMFMTGENRKNMMKNFGVDLKDIIDLKPKDILKIYPSENNDLKVSSIEGAYIIFDNISIDDYNCYQVPEYLFLYKKYRLPIDESLRSVVCRYYNSYVIGMKSVEAENNSIPIYRFIALVINENEKEK